MKEIYKNIPGYEGVYQVSNLGNVKSFKFDKERILKSGVNSRGYLQVILSKDGKLKGIKVHQLVAMSFLGHTPDGMNSVVDHIDNNRLNNHMDNLQIISNRENSSRSKIDCGVSWFKAANKWLAQIVIGGKVIYLGVFTEKQDGLDMYKLALNNIHLYNGDKKQFRNILTL